MDPGGALKLSRFFHVAYGGEGVDFVDQLNYQFSSGILVMFIVMIGFRQYVGESIIFPVEILKYYQAQNLPHRTEI